MSEVVGCEAPHIHRYRGILLQLDLRPTLVLESYPSLVIACDAGPLHHLSEVAAVICDTDTARYGAALTEGIATAVAHHGILALLPLHAAEEVCQCLEALTTIEVVRIDHRKGLVDHLLTHHHGMVGTPGLSPLLGDLVGVGDLVHALEDQLYRDQPVVLGDDLLPKRLLEVPADDEDHLAKSCLDGVIDRVVHNGLPVGAETVDLLQTSIAGAHAGSEYK